MKLCLLLIPFFLFIACDSQEFPDLSGDYAGRWVTIDRSDVLVHASVAKAIRNSANEQSIHIEIRYGQQTRQLEFAQDSKNASLVHLRGNVFSSEEIDLKIHGTCADGMIGENKVEVCWTARTLSLIRRTSQGSAIDGFVLDRNDGLPDFGDEDRSITLTFEESINRARKVTYKEAQEAERLYRAQNNIRIARRNLLPRLSGRTIISYILFPTSGFGLVDAIGNLLTFVVPANWYKVNQAEFLAEAARMSYVSLVANEVNLVETLYYTIVRDQTLYASSSKLMERAAELLRFAEDAEHIGLIDGSQAAELRASMRDLENDRTQLRYLLAEELSQFSAALAVTPVTSVTGLATVPAIELPGMVVENPPTVIAKAKLKSPEVATLRFLSRASREELKALSYAAVNPGDFFTIDFSLSARGQNVISNSREAGARSEEVLSDIERNVLTITRKQQLLLDAQKGFDTTLAEKQEEVRRLARRAEVENIRPTQFFSADKAVFEAEFRKLENAYQYMVLRAQLERLTFDGVYSEIFTSLSGQ